MQTKYKDKYIKFLGIDSKENICISEYRDCALNRKFYYPVIVSETDSRLVCSVSKDYHDITSKYFDGTIESIYVVFNNLDDKRKYKLRKMRRYTTSVKKESKATTLTYEKVDYLFSHLQMKELEEYKNKKKEILDSKRQFIIEKENRIAAFSFITEIYEDLCNIYVYTDPNSRKKGYGREVVKSSINWCLDKGLIPIYLVEEDNSGSIKLAESLDLELMNYEWIISYEK